MTARVSKRVGIVGWLGALIALVTVGITACGDESDCKEARTCSANPGEGGTTASMGGAGAASPVAGGVPGTGAGSQTDAGDSGVGGHAPVECTTSADCDDGEPANGAERCGSDGLCEFGNPPPSVVAVSPDTDATEVEPDTAIVITFSEPIEGATVIDDNIQLLDGGVPVAATLTHVGEKVTLTPDAPLALLAEFEIAVQTGVTDEAGVSMLEPHSSTFRVRDGAWHTINAVTGTFYQLANVLPVTASGDALVAWTAWDGGGKYCPTSANWFNRGVAVSAEPSVFTDKDIPDCLSVTAGANADGVGVVVWQEAVEYAQQFRGGAWGTPKEQVSKNINSHLYTSAVAPDGSVSFFQHVGNQTAVCLTDANGTWSPNCPYISKTSTGLSPVNVAFDAEGNGFAVWAARDVQSRPHILVSRFTTTSGLWSEAKVLRGSLAESSAVNYMRGWPAVAVDTDGKALVLWTSRDGSPLNTLMASRFIDEVQWSDPMPMGASTVVDGDDPPSVVFDGETFLAAWTVDSLRGGTVYTAWFDMGLDQFGPSARRSSLASTLLRMPQMVADSHHNLLLVWGKSHPSGAQLVYSRYDALGASWSGPADVTGGVVYDKAPTTTRPMPLGMNASGLGALMWGDENDEDGKLSVIRLASFH